MNRVRGAPIDLDALYRAGDRALAHVLSCVRAMTHEHRVWFEFLFGWTLYARWQHERARPGHDPDRCPFCAHVLPLDGVP